MALAIGMYKGDGVKIGSKCYKVLKVNTAEEFVMQECDIKGGALTTPFPVTAKEARQLYNSVSVSAGIGTQGMARVVISAPREIEISRLGNVDSPRSVN